MSEERKKVLEMLAAGKITAAEAERLLDKLAGSASNPSPGAETKFTADSGATKPKYVHILVDQPGRDQVNVRIPLSFVRSGRGLFAVMPKHVNERLAEYGINVGSFSTMNLDDLAQHLDELNIDIDKGNGQKVRVYCE